MENKNGVTIHSHERLDELHRNGYWIIQDPGRFCFGMDAVLLSGFAKVKPGERALDLGPASKGHALILPKAHAANIYEISDDMAAKAMILAKKMATKMTEALKCDGFNIVQNNGEPAGQTVFHFHMHLIPRYEGDQVGITWKPGTLTDEVKNEILEKLKSC